MLFWHIGLGVGVGYALICAALGIQWTRNAARRHAKRRKFKAKEASDARMWSEIDEIMERVTL